ncbi:MAG: hypothetical protein IJ477_04460 [Alistipes sp.]|nr:hypothetical protein [Alistipes sp.]
MTMLVLFALAEICVAQEAVTTSLTATTIDDVTTPKRKRVTRLDRKLKSGAPFGYKGEFLVGLTASYGTLSSEDSDFMVYLDNMNIEGALTTVKPFFGYFYRDNRLIGLRLGYQYLDGDLGSLDLDLGEQNDISLNIEGMQLTNQSFSVAAFHRSYVSLDPRGQFGLFAEIEGSMQFGRGEFINSSGDTPKYTESKNMKFKIGFNPGMAVYIFPSVCATVSIGLGGIQYTSVEQFDESGAKIGTRRASKMRFRLNVADINFGMTFHLWNKKGMAKKY